MFLRAIGNGIELRQFVLEDVAPLFVAVDRNRRYLRQWLPWVDHTNSVADVREFIVRSLAQWNAGLGPSAGIWLDGVLVGSIGCHPYDLGNRSCALGYWIGAEQQGRGTISRCCVGIIDYLFEDVGLHRIEIRCGTGNFRSCAIPGRLGFTREGLLRDAQWVNDRWVDLEVWSMLRPNWRNPIW